jgi:hypothetical protein
MSSAKKIGFFDWLLNLTRNSINLFSKEFIYTKQFHICKVSNRINFIIFSNYLYPRHIENLRITSIQGNITYVKSLQKGNRTGDPTQPMVRSITYNHPQHDHSPQQYIPFNAACPRFNPKYFSAGESDIRVVSRALTHPRQQQVCSPKDAKVNQLSSLTTVVFRTNPEVSVSLPSLVCYVVVVPKILRTAVSRSVFHSNWRTNGRSLEQRGS